MDATPSEEKEQRAFKSLDKSDRDFNLIEKAKDSCFPKILGRVLGETKVEEGDLVFYREWKWRGKKEIEDESHSAGVPDQFFLFEQSRSHSLV